MPRKPRSFDGVVEATSEVLRANRIPHVFVDAISVMAFGVPRTTGDVDLIADVRPSQVSTVCASLRRRGFFASEEDLRAAIVEGGHCMFEDRRSALRIDLVPATDPSARHALRDRVELRWHGIPVAIAGPEHTIVMKLKFGSEQDIEDALGIYVRQTDRIDLRRMRRFARQQRVLTALRALEALAKRPGQERA